MRALISCDDETATLGPLAGSVCSDLPHLLMREATAKGALPALKVEVAAQHRLVAV